MIADIIHNETTDINVLMSLTSDSKNIFSIDNITNNNSLTIVGNQIINNNTDTKNFLRLYVILLDADNQEVYRTSFFDVTDNGQRVELPVLKCTRDVVKIKFIHNGSSRNLDFTFNTNCKAGYYYLLSLDVVSCNPSIVGGVVLENIQLEEGFYPTEYTPNKKPYSYDIDNLLRNEFLHVDKWEQGTIETTGFIGSNTRCRTKSFKVKKNQAVNIKANGQYYLVFSYSIESQITPTDIKVIEGNWNGKDNVYLIDEDCYVVIVVANAPTYQLSTSITPNDVAVSVDVVSCALASLTNLNNLTNKTNHLVTSSKSIAYISNDGNVSWYKASNGKLVIQLFDYLSFLILGENSKTITLDDVVTMLSDKAIKVDTHVEIELSSYRTLCLSVIDFKLYIKSYKDITETDIVLVYNSWSNPYGNLINIANRKRIEELQKSYEVVNYPSYYTDEINDTVNKLSKLPCDNFNYLILTDIHYSYPSEFTQNKLDILMESIEKIANGSNIDAVLFLGDLIEGGSNSNRETSDNQINAVIEGFGRVRKPVLCSFGNHDNNMYNWGWTSENKNIDHYITTNEWKNKVVYPFGFDSDCYYMDFPKKNTRVIIANTADYDESVSDDGSVTISNYNEIMIRNEQLDSIAEMLSETNYNIVIGTHGLATSLLELVRKFNSNESYTKTDGSVVDFSTKANKVLVYHTGHYHNNAMEYCNTYNVNVISTSCASMSSAQQKVNGKPNISFITSWEDTIEADYLNRVIPRTKNTVNETCYDIVSVGNSKVNKIGFGASADNKLEY